MEDFKTEKGFGCRFYKETGGKKLIDNGRYDDYFGEWQVSFELFAEGDCARQDGMRLPAEAFLINIYFNRAFENWRIY